MRAKRLICLFAALAAVLLASCTEEGNTSVGIWEKGGRLPYDYPLTDYIVLGDYNGVAAPEISITYDEKAATEARAAILTEKTETVDTAASDGFTGAEALAAGYIVKADITMTADGRECDIASEKGFYVIIDGGTYFENVSDPYVSFLAGKAAEEAVKAENGEASFLCPEYYADSRYAGKKITLCAKTRGVFVPALDGTDDTEVSEHTQYATLEELKTALSAELSDKKAAAEKYAVKRILWQNIAKDATIFTPLPKHEVERCKNEYISHYKELAAYNGCSYTEYISREGLSEKDVIAAAERYADGKVREELTAFAIAEEEGLLLTRSEFEEQAYKLAASMGYAGYEELFKYNSEASVYVYLTWEKSADFSAENAVYTFNAENE